MIEIYQDEIDCGLADKIKASLSVAYLAELRPITETDKAKIAKASLQDLLKLGINHYNDALLSYNKSILVSTGWNLNDDVFDRTEVWAARRTPEDKPSNLDHNEKLIIGHMTGVWAVDETGEIIPDETEPENLPSYFHLFTNNVIYRHWEDEEFSKQVAQLLEKIENKEKYVSMECLFSNFDYALVDERGSNKVVARKADTAYLTKHLRAYGGTGMFKGMKIGRLLRNIAFSGKGYVDKPANPESIIFSEKEFLGFANASVSNDFSLPIGVLDNDNSHDGSLEMSDNHELDALRKELEDLKAAKAELEAKLAKADIAKIEEENQALLVQLAEAKKAMDEDKKKMEDMDKEHKKSKCDLEAALAQIAEFKAEAEKMQKKAKYDKRCAELTGVGVSTDEAEKTVSKFENLDDEAFAFIVELAGRASKKVDTTEAAKDALDQVTEDTTQASLADVGDTTEDGTEKTRAALVQFVTHTLANQNKKKTKK